MEIKGDALKVQQEKDLHTKCFLDDILTIETANPIWNVPPIVHERDLVFIQNKIKEVMKTVFLTRGDYEVGDEVQKWLRFVENDLSGALASINFAIKEDEKCQK